MTQFYIQTWGCQMNEYDSDRIRDLLKAQLWQETSEISAADIVVLVTCAVRKKAEDKVYNQLFSWKHQKILKEKAVICLGGCVASEDGQKALAKAPMVSVVFGPQTIHRLVSMIKEVQETGKRLVDVAFPAIEKFDFLPSPAGRQGSSAFVTIMEGCSNFCTYCSVPYTRGQEMSRSPEAVIEEIKILVSQGIREINLLGQNVNSYCGVYAGGQICNFAELLYLTAEIPGVERIRFTTSNPHDLSDEIITAFRDLPSIANSLHLPVQSGSDRILKLMGRKYDRERYFEVVSKLRAARPNISLSSDFIVGFPGETEQDFRDTMDLIDRVRFDQSFSFIYSPRPGTPAAAMEDNVPLAEKKERLYELQSRINFFAQTYSREMLDTVQKVLIDGISVRSAQELRGRTDNNRTVNFPGDPELIGSFRNVKITYVMAHTLRGELVRD